MKFNIIVAKCNNNGIGINNTLPWNIPGDLKRFSVKKIRIWCHFQALQYLRLSLYDRCIRYCTRPTSFLRCCELWAVICYDVGYHSMIQSINSSISAPQTSSARSRTNSNPKDPLE